MRALLFVIATLLLISAPVRADEVLRLWSTPLTGPLASGTEIRITPAVPRITGMPVVAAPAPSALIAPRVPPVVEAPPRAIIRPIYLPRSYQRAYPCPYVRRAGGTGGWTR